MALAVVFLIGRRCDASRRIRFASGRQFAPRAGPLRAELAPMAANVEQQKIRMLEM